MFTGNMKTIFISFAALIFIPAALIAQQGPPPGAQMQGQQQTAEVSDKELSDFASAFDNVNELHNEMNVKMVEAVEESGMTVESFNEVFEELQTAQSDDDITADKKDIDKYNKAMKKVQEVQISQEEKIDKRIEDEGLTRERYDQIYSVLQQDEETLKRFQQMKSE
ncbi:MAG: DUF4168 domain-containing protein [Candidatus Delongbacteria bacterium]